MGKDKSKSKRKKSSSVVEDSEEVVHDSDEYDEVKSDDDESIVDSGSEVGWNSEDETAFGTNKKDDEDEDEDYDDEDELQAGEVLLSDLLGNKGKNTLSKSTDNNSSVNTDAYFDNSEEEDESENSDDDEEDVSGDDVSDDDFDDEDHDEESDDNNHDGLLAMIDKYAKGKSKKKAVDNGIIVSQSAKESEFSSAIGAKGSNAVSMDDLLGAIDGNGNDIASMKQSLNGLIGSKGPPKHVEKVVANRVERALSYKDRSEDMKKWQDTVIENRNTRTLDLAQDRRQLPSYRSLIKSYEASNDMEKEVQMILLKGKEEEALEKAEEDELGGNNLTPAEIKARQDELGKVRALLFYEQMKRHRINKIKSKAYHRILKRKKKREEEKSRQALHDADFSEDDDEQLKDMTEEEAVRRIKERMNLRHHNTSKWARMAAKHSAGNKSLREAYHSAVLLGHELKNKANNTSKEGNMDNDSGQWSDEGDEGDRKSATKRAAKEIVSALQAVDEDEELEGKYGGLYKMDFMKKAKERQRERAREEATDILRDLERMEDGGTSSDDDDKHDRGNRQDDKKIDRSAAEIAKLSAAREEMKSKLGNSLSLSKSNSTSVPNSDTEDNPWLVATAAKGRSTEIMAGKREKKYSSEPSKEIFINMQALDDEDDDSDDKGNKSTLKSKKTNQNRKRKANDSPEELPVEKNDDEKTVKKKPLLATSNKTQAELVREAFSGPDFEGEFNVMKERMVDEELDIAGQKRKIESADKAGWGDWAGPGKVGVSERVVKKRKRLLKNLEEKSAEQRAGRNDGKLANVILSERRVKTSAKYKIADVPHPFTSREEYERSLQMPLGEEWNASHVVKKNAKPEIVKRAGRIIDPIALPKNYKKDAPQPISSKRIPHSGNTAAKNRSLNRNAKFF